MQEEIFLEIKGYENYLVSNLGRVYSKHKKGFLKPAVDKGDKGYLRVRLYNKSEAKTHKVHRLVAETFLENSDNLPEINHLDGFKDNNKLSNLKWCSSSENCNHAIDTGLKDLTNFKNAGKAGRKEINQFDLNGVFIAQFESISEAARETNIKLKYISRVANGRRNKTGGYVFKFA